MTTTPAPVAAGPETPGAIVTHAGNYIIPAATDGTMTCDTCSHTMPVTKFPTRPATPDGIVTRVPRCRACRDALVHARRGTPTPVADRGTIVPTPNGPRFVPAPHGANVDPLTASPNVVPIDRMAARWDTAARGLPNNTATSALDTAVAMDAALANVAA